MAASAQAQQAATPEPPKNVAEPLPEKPPAWLPGYQVRYTLRVVGAVANSTSKSVVARLPTGGWLKPDGSDVAIQAADGTALPVAVLTHVAAGETWIQFPRHGADRWYWAYGVNPAGAPAAGQPLPEGIVLEVRDWTSDDLSSWTAVRAGLSRGEPLVEGGVVAEIMQKCNPARPDVPRNYAVSYRGHLNIKDNQAGIYRFFVNSEDASFLFIDGFKVCDRPGVNARVVGTVPTKSMGVDFELKPGVHAVEVHHVLVENPNTYGGCTLLWVPPGGKAWTVVPRESFALADFGHVATIEGAAGAPAVVFDYGIDDVLLCTGGSTLYLVRFEAQGNVADPAKLEWDFGDGTRATGRSVRHVYFAPGDYRVSLAAGPPLKAFQRRVHVWGAPGEISPFSPGIIIQTLAAADWRHFSGEQQNKLLDFLASCDHTDKWPLLDSVARERLAATGLDPQFRAQLYRSLVESLGHLGRAGDLKPILEQAGKEFAKLPTLQVGVKLTAADVLYRHLKKPDEAARLYEEILEQHRRLEHPDVRLAAIHWADLVAEGGDLKRAAELYRLAATLGGESFQATAQTEAITRGALLRVAEQKLRTGNVFEARQLLGKIEMQYPEQKLEGLYRFLRAESDRYAGRYEEALASFEVLLKLRQWSGYRDRTLHGIADCYARMDNLPAALQWLAKLQEAFPKYFEAQKLADQQKLLTGRLARIKTQPVGADGKPVPLKFRDFVTGFEPEEQESFGVPKNFPIVRGLGFAGPHVGLFESHPVYQGYLTYERPLANLNPYGHYWVECWFRDSMFSLYPGYTPHMYLYLYGEGIDTHPTRGRGTYYMERSLAGWRKVGFVLDIPPAQDGRVALGSLVTGAIEIDGLCVRAVSDRELDALSNFIEGTAGAN